MAATYKAQIMAWDWAAIVETTRRDALEHVTYPVSEEVIHVDGCDGEGHIGSYYLGSVMRLTPSGKFYTFWTTNQTNDDIDRDSRWYTALEQVATKHGGWIESGDGDPTDLYFCRYWPNHEQND